jgi:hypothetical protein
MTPNPEADQSESTDPRGRLHSWNPQDAGLKVRLRDNPGRQGTTTGRSKKAGSFLMVEVDFGPNEKLFKRYEFLELATTEAGLFDLLEAGVFGGPSDLRRVLTFEKIGRADEHFLFDGGQQHGFLRSSVQACYAFHRVAGGAHANRRRSRSRQDHRGHLHLEGNPGSPIRPPPSHYLPGDAAREVAERLTQTVQHHR